MLVDPANFIYWLGVWCCSDESFSDSLSIIETVSYLLYKP